jgi:hypothetical protein
MSRKCACCDARWNETWTQTSLLYVESADDLYCEFCYAEMYHYADYDEGYQMARQEIEDGMIAEISVIYFRQDPPDCPRHWGYLQACLHEVENENV